MQDDFLSANAFLTTLLAHYDPFNAQEEQDLKEIQRRLQSGEDLWTRKNRSAHLTASCWIVSPDRTHVLMGYHRLYDAWSWLGGHADGNHDLLSVALQEAREESGLTDIRPVTTDLFSVEILCVNGHEKHGEYVPSHLHLNLTYLLEAAPEKPLRVKEDEQSDLAWFPFRDAPGASSEAWFRDRIYAKLNAKLEREVFHVPQS